MDESNLNVTNANDITTDDNAVDISIKNDDGKQQAKHIFHRFQVNSYFYLMTCTN